MRERRLAERILRVPPGRRGPILQCAIAGLPIHDLGFDVQPSALADDFLHVTREVTQMCIPADNLRDLLTPPVPIGICIHFASLMFASNVEETCSVIASAVQSLMLIHGAKAPN